MRAGVDRRSSASAARSRTSACSSHLDVIDNLLLGRHHRMRTGFLAGALWFGRAQREEIEHRAAVEEIVDLLELSPTAARPSALLPYGVQKRIELGRALAMEPRLLLLDEPVAGMNLEETEDMARYIIEIRERARLAMVLVEHDMHMVMDLADRVMALDFGGADRHGHARRGAGRPAGDRGLPGRCAHDSPDRRSRRARESLPAVLLRPRARPRRRGRAAQEAPRPLGDLHLGRLRRPGRRRRPRPARARRRARRPGGDPRGEPSGVALRRPRRRRPSAPSPSGSTRRRRPAEVEYLLEHSGAEVLVAEDEEQVDKALAVRERAADLRHIVVIDPRGVRCRRRWS